MPNLIDGYREELAGLLDDVVPADGRLRLAVIPDRPAVLAFSSSPGRMDLSRPLRPATTRSRPASWRATIQRIVEYSLKSIGAYYYKGAAPLADRLGGRVRLC